MKLDKKLKVLLSLLFFIAFNNSLLPVKLVYGGECLSSRQEMLDGYKKAISRIIENPNTKDYYLGPWIERCWYHWDRRYPNGDLNEELGEAILSTLNNSKVPQEIKVKSLEIACSAAPSNLFQKMIFLLIEGEQQELAFRTLLEIWSFNASKNQEIANYNYIKLFKEVLPEEFSPPFKDREYIYKYHSGQRLITQPDFWLCSFYSAMGRVYSFNYPKAKKILIDNDLFYPSNCSFGYIFQDPRAFEDAEYKSYAHESRFFFSLARHLELEFKIEWLKKIKPHQLRLLRNGIYATYGYKLKDSKLKSWFNSHLNNFCRSGVCGMVNDIYDSNLLSDTDKNNLSLIEELENNLEGERGNGE